MPPSIARQSRNKLSSRWPLGKDAPPSPKEKAVHEVAIYPCIVKLMPENNSCLNPSMSYEHILACGHIIATATSDEPCAPNCYHAANDRSSRKKEALGSSKGPDFYCDACVETQNEALISVDLSSVEAEDKRLGMRLRESDLRGKQTKFRKCYIALKTTSLPCNGDGTVRGRYTPRANHHPFDTTIPQVGNNFFQDVLISPTEEPHPTSDSGASESASPSTDRTDVNSSLADLGEGGSNYLQYTRFLGHKQGDAASQAPKPVSTATSKTPSRLADRNLLVAQNSDAALPVSKQQSRKRPIVIDEDEEYIDTPEEETEVFKRPAKRHRKSTITPPKAPAAKTKTRHLMKSAISRALAAAKKLRKEKSTRKRS